MDNIEVHFYTEEEMREYRERERKMEKREKFFAKIFSCLRCIFYTPLSIAFHAVSFVARGIGFVSSFGLIAGVYYLYQSFVAFRNGVPLAEIETLLTGIELVVAPFIIYAIAEISERIYHWFENNAF